MFVLERCNEQEDQDLNLYTQAKRMTFKVTSTCTNFKDFKKYGTNLTLLVLENIKHTHCNWICGGDCLISLLSLFSRRKINPVSCVDWWKMRLFEEGDHLERTSRLKDCLIQISHIWQSRTEQSSYLLSKLLSIHLRLFSLWNIQSNQKYCQNPFFTEKTTRCQQSIWLFYV